VIDECRNYGIDPPQFEERQSCLVVTFRARIGSEKRVGEKVGEKVGGKLTVNQQKILDLIVENPRMTAKELSGEIGISQRKVETNMAKLKQMGILRRVGPDKGGRWEVVV
jgi:predicted HTH transcriptional regulator